MYNSTMTKVKIFIDFESISAPFSRVGEIKRDMPYAYTLGIYKGKTFKTRTFIFNFNNESIEDVDQIMRTQILRDTRTLLANRTFKINKETSQFVSFAPVLEKKVLRTIYHGVSIYDISFGKQISLSNATASFIPSGNYFIEFKQWVDKNIEQSFISKRGLVHDGALASLAGHILLVDALNMDSRFYTAKIDIRILVKEIAEYSRDDVVRMKYINDDPKGFLETAVKVEKILKEKNAARKRLRKLENVKSYISENKETKDVKALSKELEVEIEELDKVLSKDIKLNI